MLNMFESMYKRIKRSGRYNRTVNELSRLSDRELSDIGIHRCDIQRVALEAM